MNEKNREKEEEKNRENLRRNREKESIPRAYRSPDRSP